MDTAKSEWLIKACTVLGTIASVVGVAVVFVADTGKAAVALLCVILFLSAVSLHAIFFLRKFLRAKYPTDYLKLSSFITFEAMDDNHSRYDEYRFIQSKRPILTEVQWRFKWTGSKTPKISSTLQNCNGKVSLNANGFDIARMQLKRPLRFNESTMLHFHADMDDVERNAKPMVFQKVSEPIDVINFKVVLRNKTSNPNARLIRKSMVSSTDEVLETVPFDTDTKSYQHTLPNPEVGYFYRLEWDE